MVNILPGSTLSADISNVAEIDKMFASVFMTGGLFLSQVAQISGLEPYDVQNWVKRGFLSPPVGKKYSRRQLCRILIINMLKSSMRMDSICRLLSYVNGQLDDESDDSIDDSQLYLYLVRLIAWADEHRLSGESGMDEQYESVISDYREPFPGAEQRLKNALRIMVINHSSARLRRLSEELMDNLDI